MKKLACLLLLCSGLLLFAACSSQNPEQNETVDNLTNSPATENQEKNTEDSPLAEFSIPTNAENLQLGEQSGTFPWGTSLRLAEAEYDSADGFDTFRITCTDGTVLEGLRAEGMEDETDGTLLSISTDNPAIQSYRGAYIGMTVEEFKELYPEAEYEDKTDTPYYKYSNEASGVSQIVFWFENNTLASFMIVNGIDGFLY
ncbi:MAG: hypothetical protein IJP07_01900 [Firmicutes bacterium]|nr:hypothetical protein [Bacillota bacterium]